MAVLFPLLLANSRTLVAAALVFCFLGALAGVRTPASSSLGLEQLPAHPGTMMAARTGATQLGYLVGAALGGVVIATSGYAMLSVMLAAGMLLSARLVLRVRDGSSVPAMSQGQSLSHGRLRHGCA
jgi:predicted MFS family arabinose efflux permease